MASYFTLVPRCAQHPLHTDALQLRGVNGTARREENWLANGLAPQRAQVNFSVSPHRMCNLLLGYLTAITTEKGALDMPTTETFWNQMAAYNNATLPVQAILVIAAGILTYLVFAKHGDKANVLMKMFLAFAFVWNGLVFFAIFAKSPLSTFLGAPLFILTACLFVADVFTKKIDFRLPDVKWQRYATIFWVLLAFLYPLVGYALGHFYPRTILPVAPCPLTTFAIALVAAAIPRVDKKVYVLLLLWALMGLPKCLGALECYEDCILFGAGVYGLVMLVKNWKVIGKSGERVQI